MTKSFISQGLISALKKEKRAVFAAARERNDGDLRNAQYVRKECAIRDSFAWRDVLR